MEDSIQSKYFIIPKILVPDTVLQALTTLNGYEPYTSRRKEPNLFLNICLYKGEPDELEIAYYHKIETHFAEVEIVITLEQVKEFTAYYLLNPKFAVTYLEGLYLKTLEGDSHVATNS